MPSHIWLYKKFTIKPRLPHIIHTAFKCKKMSTVKTKYLVSVTAEVAINHSIYFRFQDPEMGGVP